MATHCLFLFGTSAFKNLSYLSSVSNSFWVSLPTCCTMKNGKGHTFQREVCNFLNANIHSFIALSMGLIQPSPKLLGVKWVSLCTGNELELMTLPMVPGQFMLFLAVNICKNLICFHLYQCSTPLAKLILLWIYSWMEKKGYCMFTVYCTKLLLFSNIPLPVNKIPYLVLILYKFLLSIENPVVPFLSKLSRTIEQTVQLQNNTQTGLHSIKAWRTSFLLISSFQNRTSCASSATDI